MKYSIIIPSAFNKAESLLKPCLESIRRNTDMTDTEVIVVANGCTDDTVEQVSKFGWLAVPFQEPIGFPKAVNAGIRAARGEYLIVLNNDIVIQAPNWIQLLTAPFADPTVGVTGPMKERSTHIDQDFILFFCACISRRVIDKIGLLDEIFSPGYSEDIDFCCRAERAGFKIVQVPDESHDYYGPNRRTGNFPIYHAGNETFRDVPDPDLIHRNHAIIMQRYGKKDPEIAKAQEIDGMMGDAELRWLAKEAKKAKVIIELGSWIGRSARALADNMPEDAVLYCVDTWLGSEAEKQGYMGVVAQMDGDFACYHFTKNLFDHIVRGRVRPIRMHGRNAAQMFREQGLKADLIFIDAGHIYHEIKEDVACFLPVLAKDGIICGHDFNQPVWPDVTKAVTEDFPQVQCEQGTTIWYVESPPIPEPPPPKIFDCFTFFNELDLLEVRLEEMWDTVDRFIMVEADQTHRGKPKPFYFEAAKPRFQKYLSKISYVTTTFPDYGWDDWAREHYQRDAIMRALTVEARDTDYAIISDIDEIPKAATIRRTVKEMQTSGDPIRSLNMRFFVYYLNCQCEHSWYEGRIATVAEIKLRTPCGVRYSPPQPKVEDAGWHFSYLGGVEKVLEKLQSFAHRELDQPEFTDPNKIAERIRDSKDLFGRDEEKFRKIQINGQLPQYILNNMEKFASLCA
jgi:beta-1,4-mannosyl-glycoprotein beta-1,4-N-acetylglucosaminyltransferase